MAYLENCLPDSWGMLLQDRIFRQQGILPNQLTAMDRLAFVGDKGMGALLFCSWCLSFQPPHTRTLI